MSKASKEEILEMKLKQAFKLIKEERYGAAQHILRQFPDNPKAQAMMKMMEGKVEKRKGFAAITPRTVINIAAFFMIIAICMGVCIGMGFYASRYTMEEWALLVMGSFGDGDAAILSPAIVYCHMSQEWKSDVCLEWPLVVYTNHETAFRNCFESYRARWILELEEVLSIRRCLRSYGVPPTY